MPKVTLTYQPTATITSPGLKPGDTVTVDAYEAERLVRTGAFHRGVTGKQEPANRNGQRLEPNAPSAPVIEGESA